MKTALALAAKSDGPADWLDAASLAALRAWYEGMSTREVVSQYLADKRTAGQSSRSMIGSIKRRLVAIAIERGRRDLAQVLEETRPGKAKSARLASAAIETLRTARAPMPLIGDDVDRWLTPRLAAVLRTAGIKTLADLTLRVPRRRRWWTAIPDLGVASARRVEVFFAQHPELTERAQALTLSTRVQELVPWERLVVPEVLDGSLGTHRAPRASCVLSATNDYEAVNAWLSLHEAAATQRAYRKEAERLILWAIVERGKPFSSLSTEDAIAYRAFLRRPAPRERWIGVPCPRSSPEWRPFAGGLSARSAAYALSVLGALFRWLIEQRYVLANPFAGVKVRGTRPASLDTARVFSASEWNLLRSVADGLEWSYGWTPAAAQRLRVVLDLGYACGLRASELVDARLGDIDTDVQGDHWINVVGKGAKTGKVVLPPLARAALERYLVQRSLPVTPSKWQPRTPMIGSLDDEAGITATRLWSIVKRFFAGAATVIEEGSPSTAEKLRRATPHWMRHTHATHALDSGAELTTVRDNLRHSSISTTSMYLHSDDARRSKQIAGAFAARGS